LKFEVALPTSSIFAVCERAAKGGRGWRRGDLFGLRVWLVDLCDWTVRLDHGSTKNGEGREVTMTLEVEELLRAAVEGKQPCDYVFTHEDGKPIKGLRGVWRNQSGA